MSDRIFDPYTPYRPQISRRRILLTSRSGQLGGMELRLGAEAEFLRTFGWHCLIAPSHFTGRDRWLNRLIASNQNLQYWDFDPPPFFEEWDFRRINFLRARLVWPRRLRNAKIDLAHVFYAWTHEGGSRLALLQSAGIPAVLSIHNTFPFTEFTPWHKRITSRSFLAVRGIYGVSESALENFLKIYGTYIPDGCHVCVIQNFVDLSRFMPSPEARRLLRNELGIPMKSPLIGSVGRLDIQKQPLQVLDVFDAIWQKRRDCHLLFCGTGPLEAEVKHAVIRRPWARQTHFLGFRDDVHRVYPALDVHVLLSRQEGFGISTVEAMACGVAVVGTDVPGTRDILAHRDCGILVPFADTRAAAMAILAIVESAELTQRFSANGIELASAVYSKTIWDERVRSFYTSATNGLTT